MDSATRKWFRRSLVRIRVLPVSINPAVNGYFFTNQKRMKQERRCTGVLFICGFQDTVALSAHCPYGHGKPLLFCSKTLDVMLHEFTRLCSIVTSLPRGYFYNVISNFNTKSIYSLAVSYKVLPLRERGREKRMKTIREKTSKPSYHTPITSTADPCTTCRTPKCRKIPIFTPLTIPRYKEVRKEYCKGNNAVIFVLHLHVQ